MATGKSSRNGRKSVKRVAKRAAKTGSRIATPQRAAQRGPFPDHLVEVEVRAQIQPAAARAAGVPAMVTITDHLYDVVEVQLESGGRFFTRLDQFIADYGGAQTREAAASGQLVFPVALTSGVAQERGAGAWIIKTLRLLGIKPIDDAAKLTGETVCAWYERKQLQRLEGENDARPRLWRIGPGDTFELLPVDQLTPTDGPVLVFLHGTASSSRGSFGELWTATARDIRKRILERYGANIYAFEHFTLTQSPMRNVLDLLDQLPDAGARLHIVSHSRGGLVGEILCRAQMVDRDPFEEDEITTLFAGADHANEAAELREINRRFRKQKIKVEKFVRVACPARGTLLASERLDRWLSLSLDAIETVADLATSGFFAVFEEFVKALVQTRTDPRTLPGLEAQMPTSAVVRLLNRADTRTAADLHVIAGDIEGGAVWRRLGILLTDVYFREDHDLVVNTRAMYGGTPRVDPPRRFFAQGPDVYHFTYFRNLDTAAKVADALDKAPPQDGFEAFDQRISAPARGYRGPAPAAARDAAAAKPIVFMLPGIMGSCLDVDGQRIWVDPAALNGGGMEKLAIGASGVTASAMMPKSYGDLVQFLEATHEVVAFPFDWRVSLRVEAKRLAAALTTWLDEADKRGQPLTLLAHSLGGLLARVTIADFPQVWERIVAKPQGRLVMLGTPNGGSHAIPLMLLGREPIVQGLALIDFKHSQRKLIELIGRFPGVLELLPTNTTDDFFDAAIWKKLETLDDNGRPFWTLPDNDALHAARATRTLLDQPTPRLDRVLYVAGHALQTPWQLRLDRPPGIPQDPTGPAHAPENFYFESIAEGDGRVPWSTGILPSLRTWYMDAVHGDMAATVQHFGALRDLLTTGTTDRLPTTAPAVRATRAAVAGEAITPQPFRSPAMPYVPDAEALEAAAVGSIARKTLVPAVVRPIEVAVAHGNVVFSPVPVFVGHYEGDIITSAESALDRRLDNRLSVHRQLHLYPGPLGTVEVFWGSAGTSDFPGTAIVGLGAMGTVTPALLTSTFAHAALTYMVEQVERSDATQGMIEANIASLLIGTGWNAMPVRDSVVAILHGVVHANNELARSPYRDRVRIAAVTFIELFEDLAIEASRALVIASGEAELAGQITTRQLLMTWEGGRARALFAEAGTWWNRLQITAESDGSLRFVMLTDRARAETRLQPTQRLLVQKFVKQQIATTSSDEDIAATLFELLVPNELKDRAPEGRDLVLVLDEAAAAYPWELLQDGGATTDGDSSSADTSQLRIALRAGLIRQLQTDTFRQSVINATGNNALVVGDPKSDPRYFPELPGAQQEAQTVADAWRDHFATRSEVETGKKGVVTLLKRPQPHEVIVALFKRPYRVVHLAGHGVVDYEVPLTDEEETRLKAGERVGRRRVTGMVLGEDVFLTPAEIGQMRRVPELVFVNCCHLGATGSADDDARRDRHLLAANVATELIRIGVTAVVAAGWAVDDGAADLFARTFYEQMLTGDTFGRAVHAARKSVAAKFPHSNTWGAYQCYGDPAYRLTTDESIGADDFGANFAAQSELVMAVDHLRSDALTCDTEGLQFIRGRLDKLEGQLRGKYTAWANDAGVCAAFGLALSEVDRFDKALAFFQTAVAANPAALSVRAVEQYANLLTRSAVADHVAQRAAGTQTAKANDGYLAQIDRGIALIESLLEMGKTAERLSLLGAAHKRRAQVARTAAARNDALAKMSESYKAAHDLEIATRGRIAPYPLLNWLAAELCRNAGRLAASIRTTATDLLARVEQEINARADPDFWGLVAAADAFLTQTLMTGSLGDSRRDEIINTYRKVAARAGSPRQFRSVVENLDFLADMYEVSQSTAARRVGEKIREAAEQLRGASPSPQ